MNLFQCQFDANLCVCRRTYRDYYRRGLFAKMWGKEIVSGVQTDDKQLAVMVIAG